MSTQDETAPALARIRLGWLVRFALYNAPFAIALSVIGFTPDALQVLVVGAILFLAPGLAWTDRRTGDACVVLFSAVLASLAAALAAWLVLLPLPGPTSRVAFILILAGITNAGLVLGLMRGRFTAAPFATPIARIMALVSALAFALSYLGAAHFVPPLEDQDMETQGTAYGLIHELAPTVVTSRNTRHFFAHPLLLHFWIGESAFVSDDLDRLRHYHENSLAAADVPSTDLYERWTQDYAIFMHDPVLVPTRTPNIFLSAFIVFPLGFLVYRLTGSRAAAVVAGVVYATLPEVYVRGSYGGYMAISNFMLAAGAYFYLQASGLLPDRPDAAGSRRPARGLAFASAFLGGWADQKAVLLPLAAPAHAGLRALFDAEYRRASIESLTKGRLVQIVRSAFERPEIFAAVLIGLGFVTGWALFAAYGLSISPVEFIRDHIKEHGVWRMKGDEVSLLTPYDAGWGTYPSIVGLWREFAGHSGWLLAAPALAGSALAARRWRRGEGMLLAWVLIGAVGFSLVDWRQTKHLAHILPPLAMLIGVYWASLEGRLQKTALTALLAAGVTWNLWRIVLLMGDFSTIQPTPIW